MSRSQASVFSGDLVSDLGRKARASSAVLTGIGGEEINLVLAALADGLRTEAESILEANREDVAASTNKGLTESMIDRLRLSEKSVLAMADAVEAVMALPDPVGRVLGEWTRPNGLHIQKVSVPIGVLGMIYESRPNVTIDAAALCLKSRNAVILRGGSESLNSCLALHAVVQQALRARNLPESCVGMVPVSDRAAVTAMLTAEEYIDVMIPRGGQGLVEKVMQEARMPVFSHLDGICHVYVHSSAKPDLARGVTVNAKMRRTGICGAAETLLLDAGVPQKTATSIVQGLLDAGCEVVGDALARRLDRRIGAATEKDWQTEYLAPKISVRYVEGVEQAVGHINSNGSHHTDSILAEDAEAVAYFLSRVDSGIVMHNASTQFADGGEFGMGAEIGIATGKLHARGPVGVEQLTTYKYLVRGTGQTRP